MRTRDKIAGGVLSAAMVLALSFIPTKEDTKTKAYRDVGGVWTICSGDTFNVKPHEVRTLLQCSFSDKERIAQFMGQVAAKLTIIPTPELLTAHTSFAYNVGIAGYTKSQVLRRTNAGDLAGGCRAMLNWYRAGGRDCRVRANNCFGLIARRNDEVKLCLQGAK